MKRSLILGIIYLIPLITFPQSNTHSPAITELGTILSNCTLFIKGPYGNIDAGTAFLLGRQLEDSTNRYIRILITAAHILNKIEGEYAYLSSRRIIEKDSYKTLIKPIQIRDKDRPLWSQPIKNIDVAVMYIDLDSTAAIPMVDYKFLATDEDIDSSRIIVGDEAFCLGFPYNTPSNTAGFPILRSGKIASYPITPTNKYSEMLLDIRAYPGGSGGPVFTNTIIKRDPFNQIRMTQPLIIGLVSGEAISSDTLHTLELSKIIPSPFIRKAIESLKWPLIFENLPSRK